MTRDEADADKTRRGRATLCVHVENGNGSGPVLETLTPIVRSRRRGAKRYGDASQAPQCRQPARRKRFAHDGLTKSGAPN